jgi:hypothetical protein
MREHRAVWIEGKPQHDYSFIQRKSFGDDGKVIFIHLIGEARVENSFKKSWLKSPLKLRWSYENRTF